MRKLRLALMPESEAILARRLLRRTTHCVKAPWAHAPGKDRQAEAAHAVVGQGGRQLHPRPPLVGQWIPLVEQAEQDGKGQWSDGDVEGPKMGM